MFKTIKTRFIISAVIFIVLSVGIPTYILLNQFQENFNDRSVMMLESTVDILRYGLHTAMMQGDKKDIEEVVKKINETKGVRHIRIFDENGKIRYSSNPDDTGKNILTLEPKHLPDNNFQKKKIRLMKPEGIYTITEPILNSSECRSCHKESNAIAYLDVDTDLTTAEVIFYTGSRHMIFMGIAVIVVLSTGLYFIFGFFISNPLDKLISALKTVEEGNLDIELQADRIDEMGSVFRRFNLMTKKIKTSREEIAELHFEQLQRANRLKILGELNSQTAHEINNHTAIIMSRADYLDLECAENPQLNNYRDDFKVILDQTNKISFITNNILRHSKKAVKKIEKINLNESISKTLRIFEPLMIKSKIKYKLESGIENAFIKADALEIEQVLINILKNSIDAIENDGEIKISLTNLSGNGKFQLMVKDTGCGISMDKLNQIFSPFYTSKPQDKGTGLGLYIVQNICKHNQIDINVNSEYLKGTTFTLEFNEYRD